MASRIPQSFIKRPIPKGPTVGYGQALIKKYVYSEEDGIYKLCII